MKLEPPNTHHLNAAQGWLGLGLSDDACRELEQIPAALQSHPEVLEVRWQICAKKGKWQECVTLANQLIETAPSLPQGWIHRSYALHELKQTREALDVLLPALALFPKDWLIQYNLACYCCRLSQFDRTLQFLKQALKLGDAREVKQMALADADLKEVWELIATL